MSLATLIHRSSQPSPIVSAAQAQGLLQAYYGLHGVLTPLGSQQDINFLVDTDNGRFVLKICHGDYATSELQAQHAALACFQPDTLTILEERRAEFGRRRDFLLPALRELGFGIAVEPEGAFYLYADISRFGGDAFAFCQHFLETEHLAFTPGLDFGRHQASHHVRFAYTQSLPRLQQAVERIARGLRSWQG